MLRKKVFPVLVVLLIFITGLGMSVYVSAREPASSTNDLNMEFDKAGDGSICADKTVQPSVEGKSTLTVGETASYKFKASSQNGDYYVDEIKRISQDPWGIVSVPSNVEGDTLTVTALEAGTTTITCEPYMYQDITTCEKKTTEVDGTLTFQITVIPKEAVDMQLRMDPAKADLSVGASTTLKPVFPSTYTGNKAGRWRSSNAGVAKVADGVVTGVAEGSATITFTHAASGKTAEATVTVKKVSLALSPAASGIYVGNTQAFNVIFADGYNGEKAGTWDSSNPAVASVKDGTATGLAVGTTTITFTHTASGETASATLTVYRRPEPRVLPVTPPPAPAPVDTSTGTPAPNPNPTPAAPTLVGETEISLPMGYAQHTEGYMVLPITGVTQSLDAGGTGATFQQGQLIIPAGLAPGSYTIVLHAANAGGTTSLNVTLTVFPVYPTITGPDTLQASAGVPVTESYTVDGLAGTTATISTEAGKNTAGATLSGAVPNVTLNIPGNLPKGNYVTTIVADTGGYRVEKAVSITVTEVVAVTVSCSNPDATIRSSESLTIFEFSAAGGTAPYTFAVDTPPPGFEWIDDHRIMKTEPTTPVGTYPFTVTATDTNGLLGTTQATLTVIPDV